MTEKKAGPEDVAILCGPTDDGKGARVVRARAGVLSTGEIRPAKDGEPINGAELVRLCPREGVPRVCDVEVLHAGTQTAQLPVALDGPAQVATEEYRHNWERIFGALPLGRGRDTSLN
jgi:hypothetical protein